ncbi:MAG: hypothetical protein JNK05_39550 [Myxococcales bacterium]|nr:hypothetical protein [Myxococcales bacterium]
MNELRAGSARVFDDRRERAALRRSAQRDNGRPRFIRAPTYVASVVSVVLSSMLSRHFAARIVLGATLAGCPSRSATDASADETMRVADSIIGDSIDSETSESEDSGTACTADGGANSTTDATLGDARATEGDSGDAEFDASDIDSDLIDTGTSDGNNSTCANATPMRANVETRIETSIRRFGVCDGGTITGYAYHSFRIPPRSWVNFTFRSDSPRDSLEYFIFDSCSAGNCLAANSIGREVISIDNSESTPRTVFVAVTGGSGSITPRVTPMALNSQCQTPTAVWTCSVPTAGDFAEGTPIPRCWTSSLYYSVTVPPESKARIAITSAPYAVVARVVSSCPATDCPREETTNPVLFVPNGSSTPRTFIIQLASRTTTPFTIAYTANEHVASSCETPRVIEEGSSVTAETTSATTVASCAPSDGRQLFYAVSLASISQANLTLERLGEHNVRARVLYSCSTTICPPVIETNGSGATPFRIDNPNGHPQTFIVAVSGVSGAASFRLTHARPPPSNIDCARAGFISVFSERSARVDTTLAGAPPVGCEQSEGRVLYYRVIVAENSRVTVTLSRVGATDMRMRHLADCSGTSCVASAATSGSTPASIEFINRSSVMTGFLLTVGAVGNASSTGVGILSISQEARL